MCVGSLDACAGIVAVPFFIILAPIVCLYRLLQGIFWDIPMYLYTCTRKPEIKPPEQVQEEYQEISQPEILRITIPVCEDPVESV